MSARHELIRDLANRRLAEILAHVDLRADQSAVLADEVWAEATWYVDILLPLATPASPLSPLPGHTPACASSPPAPSHAVAMPGPDTRPGRGPRPAPGCPDPARPPQSRLRTARSTRPMTESSNTPRRCLYITVANQQCLLASGHDGAHDVIGDQYSQAEANDPGWGRKRAEAWRKVEQSEIVGNLYRRCTRPRCGHTAGGHIPGGRCVAAPETCSCAGFLADVAQDAPMSAREEVLRGHTPTCSGRAVSTGDCGPIFCAQCSEDAHDWVTYTPEHVAAALEAALGEREGDRGKVKCTNPPDSARAALEPCADPRCPLHGATPVKSASRDRLAAVEALPDAWQKYADGLGGTNEDNYTRIGLRRAARDLCAALDVPAGTLAKQDAGVRASALREAADDLYGDERAEGEHWHPLSIASWLRERADRIEAEAATR